MRRHKRENTPKEDVSTSDLDALRKEFEEDPDAYMEKRTRLLGKGGYEQARQEALQRQNEAIKARGRMILRKLLHPTFGRGESGQEREA